MRPFASRPAHVPWIAALIVMLAAPAWAGRGEQRRHASPERAPSESAERWVAPLVDVARLLREDEDARVRPGLPHRVGYPMKTDLSPTNSGTWEERPGGERVWRLRLNSPGALWVVVGLETFRLAAGGRLLVYDPARATVLGPFTSNDVRAHGQLWFPPIAGDSVVLELEWPASLRSVEPKLRVGTVAHGYKAWGGIGEPVDDPGEETPTSSAAGTCHVDVNCPAGDDWQDEKRGVVQLLSGGSAFCTGSLINNTAADCRPLVLTAAHCATGPSTTFRFNYERPGCESGAAPTGQTRTGASVLASDAASDFALLELDEAPPANFEAYFNGWQRSASVVLRSWGLHHPSGDVKKISHDEDPLQGGLHWGPSHWRVAGWDLGTTEQGSSGSPLFDAQGRILGQLHGGTASCTFEGWDEYGKLSFSWEGGATPDTRLRDWLDPLGSGATALEGLDATACVAPRPDLQYAGYEVDDTPGNGNGVAEPGETVQLRVRVANQGTLAATEVVSTLSVSSPTGVTAEGLATWPVIASDDEALSEPPSFSLQIDTGWSCGAPIDLELDLTAAESPGAWSMPFQLPTGSSDPTTVFVDDIEGTLQGWTAEPAVGADAWATTTARSSSPAASWFVPNLAQVSDSRLVMPLLADLPEAAALQFEHYLNSEAGYDGGVLEYSTDGTSWLDAGPLIVFGAYNGTLDLAQTSVLTGRPAWTGDLDGWQTVVADLSPLAGSDVEFRWRFATDALQADEGWYVDDVVVISRGAQCAPILPHPPGETSAPTGVMPPFTLAVTDGGYRLEWGAPDSGGAVTDYVLYSVPLAAPFDPPVCEGGLGSGTAATLAGLADDRGFLVVARNEAGEGSYGWQSSGAPRTPPEATPCP